MFSLSLVWLILILNVKISGALLTMRSYMPNFYLQSHFSNLVYCIWSSLYFSSNESSNIFNTIYLLYVFTAFNLCIVKIRNLLIFQFYKYYTFYRLSA